MGTETASAAPQSMPAALMRAAQAIVDRRNSSAANAGVPGPGGGGGPPPSGSDAAASDAAPRAPDPGARSFQAMQARPGQLLGTIGTLTAPSADGSGYEVRHADSGRLIARGGSAQEAQGRAQDLAGWLGRRRMVGWLQGGTRTPPAALQEGVGGQGVDGSPRLRGSGGTSRMDGAGALGDGSVDSHTAPADQGVIFKPQLTPSTALGLAKPPASTPGAEGAKDGNNDYYTTRDGARVKEISDEGGENAGIFRSDGSIDPRFEPPDAGGLPPPKGPRELAERAYEMQGDRLVAPEDTLALRAEIRAALKSGDLTKAESFLLREADYALYEKAQVDGISPPNLGDIYEHFGIKSSESPPLSERITLGEGDRILHRVPVGSLDDFKAASFSPKPNTIYSYDGYEYTTDDRGRAISRQGLLQKAAIGEDLRFSNDSEIGKGKDAQPGDVGFHAGANQFRFRGGPLNVSPGNGDLNNREYKAFEYKLARMRDSGSRVDTDFETVFNPGNNTSRPDVYRIVYKIDNGKLQEKKFNNRRGG